MFSAIEQSINILSGFSDASKIIWGSLKLENEPVSVTGVLLAWPLSLSIDILFFVT